MGNEFFLRRIRGLVKAKALHEQVAGMEKIATQMKANKEQTYQQIHQLKQRIDQLIQQITVITVERTFFGKILFSFQNTQMTADDIESAYNELVSSIERESRRLRQTLAEQQMKDEEERLKKIQVSLR